MRIIIDNIDPSGLVPFLQLLLQKGNIMTALEDLQAKAAATAAAITDLAAAVEAGNANTDTLIAVANSTKDALVALQGQAAGGVVISAADIASVISTLDNGITAAAAAKDAVAAQSAETLAAASADAP